MYAFEFAAATKWYAGRRLALAGIDLAVPAGTVLGMLGPNGAGKTTALKLLLGFSRPSRGAARLFGRDPYDAAARVGVGYLPERLMLPGAMTLRAFLRLHAGLIGLSGAAATRAVETVAETTGVRDRMAERLASLSKGLAQRVGFASALLDDPAVLVLDEPTSGLDPLGVRDARDWIQAARSRGATILVCSHVLSEVERTCDEVVILDGGRIATAGALETLISPGESLEDAFVRAVRG